MSRMPRASPITAAMTFVVIGMQVFIIQPGIVQGFVSRLGLTEARAGYLASAEMFGIAAATVLSAMFSAKVNWKWLCGAALAILAAADLSSAVIHDYAGLVAVRALAGLASGVLISLGYAVVGAGAHPDRNFGLLITFVLAYGALGLWAIPTGLDRIGVPGIMLVLALMPLGGGVLLASFPSALPTADAQGGSVPGQRRQGALMLASVLAFFLGQGVIWAYLFLIGTHMGIDEQTVANGLTVAQFAGIAGAFAAAVLAARVATAVLFVLGIVLSIAPLYFLSLRLDGVAYGAAVIVFNWAANLLTPLLVAMVARLEARWVQPAAALQMLGLAVGPAIAATLMDASGYSPILALCGALFTASFILGLRPSLVPAAPI